MAQGFGLVDCINSNEFGYLASCLQVYPHFSDADSLRRVQLREAQPRVVPVINGSWSFLRSLLKLIFFDVGCNFEVSSKSHAQLGMIQLNQVRRGRS